MEEIMDKYLDDRNTSLFFKLNKKHEIVLVKFPPRPDGKNNIWQLTSQQEKFSIGYYEDVNTSAPFTHELLHIDLIDKGFSDFTEILQDIDDGVRSAIFQPIIAHLNNVFAHEKFYLTFLNMGYMTQEFVIDFNEVFDPQKSIVQIENSSFDKPELPNDGIYIYITSFFTAKDNRNPSKIDDFITLLNYLREKDSILYRILDNTWTLWVSSKSLNNREFLQHLFDETEQWYKNRSRMI